MKYNFLKYYIIAQTISSIMIVAHWRAVAKFYLFTRRLPRLCPPTHAHDKYLWRKIFDHNPLFQTFCDKLACKEWVKKKYPNINVPPTIWQGDSVDVLPEQLLCQRVFVKVSNGSGYNMLIEPPCIDRELVENRFRRWLARPYGQDKSEWGYKDVPRKVFVETVIADDDGSPPIMTNVYTCEGEPKAVFCIVGMKGSPRKAAFFDPSGERLDYKHDAFEDLPASWRPPIVFREAVSIAKVLAEGTDQIRCDFMCTQDKVWFSEMTPYTLSGLHPFSSPEEEKQLFGDWHLQKSWFLSTPQRGWRRLYAEAFLNLMES